MRPFKTKAERVAEEWARISAIKSDDFGIERITALSGFITRHRLEIVSSSPNIKIAMIVIAAAKQLAELRSDPDTGSDVLRSVVENSRSRQVREAAVSAYQAIHGHTPFVKIPTPPAASREWKWDSPPNNT